MKTFRKGQKVSLKELVVNDLFYMTYGLGKVKFRVHKIFEDDGVLAHSVNWCKADCIFIPHDTQLAIHYAGRMSKIRGLLML